MFRVEYKQYSRYWIIDVYKALLENETKQRMTDNLKFAIMHSLLYFSVFSPLRNHIRRDVREILTLSYG